MEVEAHDYSKESEANNKRFTSLQIKIVDFDEQKKFFTDISGLEMVQKTVGENETEFVAMTSSCSVRD